MQTSEKLININDGAHRKIIFSLLNKDKKKFVALLLWLSHESYLHDTMIMIHPR